MEEILKLIKQYDGEVYNLCYKLLNENEQQAEVFQYVCENLLEKPETPAIRIDEYFSKDEIEEYKSMYGDMVDGFIESTIKRCDYGSIKPEDFYKTLWNSYSATMPSLKELAFAFYYTVIDRKIPYIFIGKPLSMEADRYKEILKNSEDYIKKIDYIFRLSYKQKTEIASLVLQCIDDIDDYDTKVVMLARVLDLSYLKRKPGGNINLERMIRAIEKERAQVNP